MEPIPLFPIISGYCAGFFATFFDVWSHYLMAFMVAIMSAQVEWLVYCFMKKHQTLGKIMCRHVCPRFLFMLGEIGMPFFPVLVYIAFCKAGMPRGEQMSYVREHYIQFVSGFSSLKNFAIYTYNFWFILMAVIAIFGGAFCGLVFTLSTWDMFKILKGVQRKISTTNYKRHQAAVRSLLAQFAVTSICLCPPVLFVVVILSEFRYAQVTVQFLLAVFASHSSVNAVVLVMTTPPFRNYVLR
ncbi:hypothetical protein GCK72_006888 [Caenorhabditis remanei]|uniref:Uncharacterized protein n=1 Tax=Caenorhabditis remanei TaxID=31234 RepID=A0A6A5HG41_CAERE|nr:hypothetical protein GCK72_006888 [Caenorhabditis remanei]KAF1766930.1 hypothetical protein GCK72_006888 [Caenorhabditis remanei]